jgi:class 3 adenylate cyclase/tetratricopeptide (TPR) repeat protein
MKESRNAYVPQDRLLALVDGEELPLQAKGSVLFADISGFTPLTEAYEAHLGSRKGGEQLTRVLNEVYAMLIGEVDRMRGSVIGFAGDAITCWFDEDNGHRAVDAALAMQAGMDKFKAIPSPAGGTIALGLKAAVTCGTVQRFIVGDEDIQRVDVLAGDPVYRVAAAEGAAERGEVVIDEPTRRALGQAVTVGEEKKEADGSNIGWVVTAASPATGVQPWPDLLSLEIDREVVDPWMIASIRERMAAGLGEFFTELRPATTLFLKFDGIDFDGDPEATRKLDAFFSTVQHIVADYEGVVHQLTVGDKGSFLYAAFGAPISHEDDTQRAMSAALRLSKLTTSFKFISTIQIGIGRGTTRTGAYGGPSRRTYGVLGDQVNLAARLMGKAKPGQILVSDEAAREGKSGYNLQSLDPVMVKGKSKPIALYSLEGKVENRHRKQAGYALPMVGRKAELERLLDLFKPALEGRGQAATIMADVGMGKTRLLHEVTAQARAGGFRVLSGECQAFGTNTQYTPWWGIWRDLFGIEDEATAEERLLAYLKGVDERLVPRLPLLGPVLNIPLQDNELTRMFDVKLRRASLESLLVECLRAEAVRQPLLLIIEDAHAIDVGSRDLLRMILQAIAKAPVLILVTHRPCPKDTILGREEKALEYVHNLQLAEFTDEESADLIRQKYAQLFNDPKPLPAEIVDRIANRTGNNPFFIDEVMNWVRRQDIDILSAAALEKAELPVSLYALVLSRMDQLDESSRVTMKVASVIGRLFRAAVVWGVYPELGGEVQVMGALDKLTLQDFTEREEEDAELVYLFKHVVIHEVAYESLPHQLREHLHEAIGNFIEARYPQTASQVLDLLAFHFGRSRNTDKQRKYFLLAGDAARAAYADRNAAAYYERVLPLLSDAEQVPVLRKLGQVREFAGDWDSAMETYRKALELSEQLDLQQEAAGCKLDIGDLLRKRGTFDEATRWLKEARRAFEELDYPAGVGQALHSEGTLSAQTGLYDRARDLYTRSMKIRRDLGDLSKVASLLSNTGIIARFQGKLDEALLLQLESLSIRRGLNDAWAIGNSLNNLGMAKRYKGDFAGARNDLEEALRILKKVGDRAEIANTLNSLAELALDQQDTDACEKYLEESLQLTRELGNLRGLAFLFEAFAANAFMQKRPERCLRLFGAAAALRESIGAPLPESDMDRIEETIDLAGQSMRAGNPADLIAEGAALPLSSALEFAASPE